MQLSFFLPKIPCLAITLSQTEFAKTYSLFTLFENLPSGLYAIFIATVFMGIASGILGSFLVVKRLSMVGDTLAHAILPGLLIGFMIAETKHSALLFVGAMVAGFIGIGLVNAIRHYLPLKEDSALGIVLTGFYAVGIALLSYIQQSSLESKAGIDKILFGQAAALNREDVVVLGFMALICSLWVGLCFRSSVLIAFDKRFASTLNWPVRFFESLFLILLNTTIIISLKSSGIILISALLIIPASSAYLLTKNFKRLIVLAISQSVLSGLIGVILSLLKPGIPTGPCIITTAGGFFFLSWLLGPEGLIAQWMHKKRLQRTILLENILKALYLMNESQPVGLPIDLGALCHKAQLPQSAVLWALKKLVQTNDCQIYFSNKPIRKIELTPQGALKAAQIVRNHHLWELYLTDVVHYAPDHVHDDAEKIEHILGEDLVKKLEARLNYPKTDPHGRVIP